MIEHRLTIEARDVRVDHPVYPSTIVQVRYVCSCGAASRWRESASIAMGEIRWHATDGQQAWPL